MTDISQAILQQTGLKTSAFASTSRYYPIATTTINDKNGEPIVYLKRRFVPGADRFFILQQHTVREGERLDNITAQYYGDPERFWQVCDANNVMEPDSLTEEPGIVINITLPEGIAGNSNA
ncbi:MAG: LysM domain-containing protein [Bacteroidetes bacterium]|nr:LysM domain-containing protein [Bacteroidota bacterium]